MFFKDSIQRRLVSLLNPWLLQELELELKLGFLRSHGVAKNLSFDTSALNRQVFDESSSWSFKEFTVERLSLHVSYWSVPTFIIEVCGVHVTLSLGELKEERRSRVKRKSIDTALEDRKKVLAEIDPEGSALHDVLQKLSDVNSSRNWKTSLLNVILEHCQLQMHDIHLQVQFPFATESFGILCEIMEFNVGASRTTGCFLKSLIGTIIAPLADFSLTCDVIGVEIGLKKRDDISCLISSVDLFTRMKFKDLHLVDCSLHAPELRFSISPAELAIIFVFYALLGNESNYVRNGRHLWNIAANRISLLISTPRSSLHKLVVMVCLWLRYVNTYVDLLSLLGYPENGAMKISALKMSEDGVFSASVEKQWRLLSEIEKKLPVEAIARARRITRYRAAFRMQCVGKCSNTSLVNDHLNIFRRILVLTDLIWNIICRICNSLVNLLSQGILGKHPQDDGEKVASEDSCAQSCFILSIGLISFAISPLNHAQSLIFGDQISDVESSSLDLLEICVSVGGLLLLCRESISEQCFSISCGQLKINSSSPTKDGPKNINNPKGYLKREVDDLKTTVLRTEPAHMFYFHENCTTADVNETVGSCVSYLQDLLGELWSNWKKSCTGFERSEIPCRENPWILSEIKRSVTDQNLKYLGSGLWKCSLVVGKLHFLLDYSSLLSTALVLRQIQYVYFWTQNNGANILLHTPVTSEVPQPITWDDRCKLYFGEVEDKLLKMIPQNYIQIGVFIAGPLIQLSLGEELFHCRFTNESHIARQEDFHLVLDVDNIELAIWPALASDVVPSSELRGLHDAGHTGFPSKEPQTSNISKSDSETFTCQGQVSLSTYLKVNGLKAFLDNSAEKKNYQIVVLNPTTITLSLMREDVYSFSTAVIAISATWHGVTAGLAVRFLMDELFVIIKVLFNVYYAISCAVSGFNLNTGVRFQELRRREMVFVDFERETLLVTRTKTVSLTHRKAICVFNGKFEIRSMEMVFHNSRGSNIVENYVVSFGSISAKKLVMHDLPDYGTLVSAKKMALEVSFEEGKVNFFAELFDIQSVIFRDQGENWTISDHFQVSDLLNSPSCLCEISLSHCASALRLASVHDASPSGSATDTHSSILSMINDSSSGIAAERSNLQCSSDGTAPGSNYWLVMNITTSEIFMAGFSGKKISVGAEKSNKLESSISVGREFQTIVCHTQGGSLLLETAALALFVECFSSYHCCIKNLLHVVPEHMVTGTADNMTVHNGHPSEVNQNRHQQMLWEQLEELTIDLSQISLVLVAADDSGGFRELLFEADFHLNLENVNGRFSFDLSRFSILSQTLHEVVEKQTSDIQVPHFSTFMSSNPPSHLVYEDPAVELQCTDRIYPVLDDASCSSHPVSKNNSLVDNSASKVWHFSRQNYILKRLSVSIAVERPVQGEIVRSQPLDVAWIGSGSVTGFDMAISLPEIQMVLSTFDSLSGLSSKRTSDNVEQRHWSGYHESSRSCIEMVPDGALVAIQDVDQHMYMTVDGIEGKYNLVGAIHYSLVGERALFRVKYQNQKRWNSSALWFSLISLYAKSGSGEPLRLNYRQGSGFVDISCSNDDRQAHWRAIACHSEYYEGDTKPESYSLSAWNTFYLVNKKIDQAVAFVDEAPEFVSKPGNPFKWKVFHDFYLVPDIRLLDSHTGAACRTSVQDLHVNNNRASGQTGFLPCINISLDKVILTIVHELPDTKETFPLLQASVSTMEFDVQLLFSKMRVMSRISFALYYFDGETNLWREFINPVEMHIFFRSRFQIQSAEIGSHTVWVHFYARIKELGISITGLSLDILLFVIGTLNLAGPYAIKVSKILAHCCKVENHSGLDLLCHFYDNQDASVASKQASTIFLRHLALMHQPTEASYVSIQLAQQGTYMTSPINMSLLEAGSLAWRTRIVSIQGSKTYPGPFLVIDTSRKSEEGFSIAVSPLLRIHNETKYSLELRFRRPQNEASEYASVFLKTGDTIDDSVAAFDAINFSGVLKKALMSLSVGNFLFSFRPEITKDLTKSKGPISVDWSVDLKGGKSVRISGIFDKLSYKVRKAFSVKPVRYSFSTARCSLEFEDGQVADLHFLIQSTSRDIPVILPDNFGFAPGNRDSPVALKEQKEIFVLPTFRIFNLLQAEIHVLLTDTDPCAIVGRENFGNQATIPCGEAADLYANPATIYFIVTLTVSSLSCKPVNSGDCIKKLQKQKSDVRYLDVNLDFGGGKYFASLRLSRGHKGMLEVAIFTSYTLRNESNLSLLCFASNQKPFSRDEAEKLDSVIPPELGPLLPQKSTKSWLMKPNKVRLKLLEEKSSEVLLDLDALSGFAEIGLEAEGISGSKRITKLGLSLGPLTDKVQVSSQIITIVPRYVVFNESEEAISICQCNFEDDLEGMIAINSKQKLALRLRGGTMKRETSIFEKFVRKHRNAHDDSSTFIQFRLNEAGLGWSGPVCIASLGRFFVKFRRSSDLSVEQSYHATAYSRSSPEFAAVHVVEENSTLVMHFRKPPDLNLPYRIENNLHQTFITYYQKELLEPEFLGPGSAVDYVWDDLTHPRRLIVQIDGLNLLREINLDKVRGWKPFYRVSQHSGLGSHLPLDKNLGDPKKAGSSKSLGQQMVNFGYEVFADGTTRVLRLSEFHDSFKKDSLFHRSKRVRIRISSIALNLLEHAKQETDTSEASISTPIVVARIGNVNLDFVLTDMHNYSQMTVQSLSVDQKWVGAPFAAMLRRHQSDSSNTNDNILRIVLVLLSSCSGIKQIKYSSVILQPLDLNLDEETLLKIAPFWRTSLSDSNSQSQQYYFDHFEIHPIKIIASFLPGDSYSSYSSTQETLRTLLHSVIKIPAIESRTVELNGVLVTHALITIRELFVKCAQHYSWYAMRAIYIAKGSPLLPPAFASIFDDLASSSLDAFFDPSSGLISLPGLTIGTFKLISKCIDGKGFSGTKRYLGDLGKTMKTAGSNVMFAAVTEISDSVLKGAEASGLSGVVRGFQQGVLKLAMEPSVLSAAFMEGGPDRKIVLDRSPGIDELYIEGYLQAMLDSIYKQEYLRVRVVDNQVYLKNLPPNSSLIEEIMDRVKGFLVSKALLKGDPSASQPLRHLRGPTEWKIGPTVVTLCEHLFVSFAIRFLRKQASKFISNVKWKIKFKGNDQKAIVPASTTDGQKIKLSWKFGIGKFVFSGILAYIDGRLCRCIPHPVVRRIVSGFVLSFLDKDDNE